MTCSGAKELQSAFGTAAVGIKCNVSSKAEVADLITQSVQEVGGLDILVANAGIAESIGFLEMSEEDFDAVLGVNLKGTFLVRLSQHDSSSSQYLSLQAECCVQHASCT